jgi:hypothetical protein
MEIKAGTYWKTRDGRKAYVAAVLENPLGAVGTCYPVLGYIGDIYASWRLDGRASREPEVPGDLIAEWREPREWTVYVCEDRVYQSVPNPTVYPLLDEPPVHGKLVARVVVREGEGVE